jgi:hypothetical protein
MRCRPQAKPAPAAFLESCRAIAVSRHAIIEEEDGDDG